MSIIAPTIRIEIVTLFMHCLGLTPAALNATHSGYLIIQQRACLPEAAAPQCTHPRKPDPTIALDLPLLIPGLVFNAHVGNRAYTGAVPRAATVK